MRGRKREGKYRHYGLHSKWATRDLFRNTFRFKAGKSANVVNFKFLELHDIRLWSLSLKPLLLNSCFFFCSGSTRPLTLLWSYGFWQPLYGATSALAEPSYSPGCQCQICVYISIAADNPRLIDALLFCTCVDRDAIRPIFHLTPP